MNGLVLPGVTPEPLIFDLDEPAPVIVHLYRTATLLERNDGKVRQLYPINIESLNAVLGNIPTTTGILPRDVVSIGRYDGKDLIIKYIHPQRRNLIVGTSNEQVISIVTPPLIWTGCGTQYKLFALASTEWPTEQTMLYHAPFPNVFTNGGICWGDVGRPLGANVATIDTMLARFFESRFAAHIDNLRSRKYPKSVIDFWETITTLETYPLDDLIPVPQMRVINLLEGRNYANTR